MGEWIDCIKCYWHASLSKLAALNSYANLPVQRIPRNANACYDVYKHFLRDNCNSSRNRSAGRCWDGTFEREGYVMCIAECICCRCKDENGDLLYLVRWGDWRKFDPSWITCEDLIHQIKSEYIYLLLTFDDRAESFTWVAYFWWLCRKLYLSRRLLW